MKLSLAGKPILIVEDNPVLRKSIRDMLYGLNADTLVEAESGLAAVNAMLKTTFEIVLCDYNLGPGKNGQQVLEEARHRKLIDYRSIFILISSEQSTGAVLGAMDSKPDEYLTKPFNAQQLISRLSRHFVRRDYLAGVEKAMARGDLAQAIRQCDVLLERGDLKMRMHLLKMRAELAASVGDFETAQRIYLEVLQHRDLPWARLGLGMIDLQNNNIEQAIAAFQSLVAENPMLMEGYDWLTRAYELLDRHQEVEQVLQQALELSPQSILRQKKFAETADKNGNLEAAERAYKVVLKLGKHSVHGSCSDYAGLAKLYAKTSAGDEALKMLNEMRQEYAGQPEAELRGAALEADLFRVRGDEEAAQLALEKALQLCGRMGGKVSRELQLEVARACFLNEQHDKAETILHGLIQNHIDDESFLKNLRAMQSGIGMHNHSEILIQKTKQALVATNNKGVALYKQGKFEEALDLFEQAFSAMPENKTIILNMLKIMIHDLKVNPFDEDKEHRVQTLLKKAKQLGVEQHKLGLLQLEFGKLQRPAVAKV